MRVDLFDFDLPSDRIALRPASPRDAARLLIVRPGGVEDRIVRDLPDLLQPGDALVFNDTRVIPAQLEGIRERDGAVATISATLHRRLAPERWLAFVKGAKKLQPGDLVRFGETPEACLLAALHATVISKDDDGVVLEFEFSGAYLDEAIARVGHVPLPPYIASKRPEDLQDRADYQTVYARDEGSVAAPTAGLHFTPDLMERLEAKGVSLHFLTLHVGAGTFLPVKADDTADHRMHPEYGLVTAETAAALNAVRARGGRVVAVGTTSLRLLESAAAEDGTIRPFAAETSIFITPGYRFRAVDALMTNFHLPRSTLFMLVSAFAGLETMKAAYAHALATGYRFYSYGDGSLILREAR
ncbi:MAG: tRNA preQ1(34) S-adenosylmethionine ribosyltransferase-isomerase QueA [Proteobacteria bacterium]|nr:tRNA preQ1(34) S-adenosylmethionine ribosyltransferase-isomerase QueA [Pseudomonadota bacterium]